MSYAYIESELGGGGESKPTIENVNTSPHQITAWNSVIVVDNTSEEITLNLPSITSDVVGQFIELWYVANPLNYNVIIVAGDETQIINGLPVDGINLPKASVRNNRDQYDKMQVRCTSLVDVLIDDADHVFTFDIHFGNFDYVSPDLSNGYDYFEYSPNALGDFLTNNGDWWFACKVENSLALSANAQTLFSSNNYGIAIRQDYFISVGTTGYLAAMSPSLWPDAGSWILVQYISASNDYNCWVNETKVVSLVSMVNPTGTMPTNVLFGGEPISANYFFNQTGGFSSLVIGSGEITDVDASYFTPTLYNATDVAFAGSAAVVSEVHFDDLGPVTHFGAETVSENPGATNISYLSL